MYYYSDFFNTKLIQYFYNEIWRNKFPFFHKFSSILIIPKKDIILSQFLINLIFEFSLNSYYTWSIHKIEPILRVSFIIFYSLWWRCKLSLKAYNLWNWLRLHEYYHRINVKIFEFLKTFHCFNFIFIVRVM